MHYRSRQPPVVTGLFLAILALYCKPAASQELSVTFLHTPPKQVIEGQDFVVNGNIIGADQVSIAALNFRTQGETEFQVRELKLISGEHYQGTIPGKFVRPPALEYFCYAVDFDGNRRMIFSSEEEPHRLAVIVQEHPKQDNDTDPDQETRHQDEEEAAPVSGILPRSRLVPDTVGTKHMVGGSQVEAMGAATLADVLDQIPGLTVSRSVSGHYRLAVRGIQSEPEVLVLLDGHRINDLYSGSAFLEFPAEAIERLEVVNGPGSLEHGGGALVGVVNVVTRKSEDVRARVAYGRFNTIRASTQGGYGTKTFSVGGQIQFLTTDGHDRTVASDALTGIQGDDQVSNSPGAVDDQRLLMHCQLQGGLKDLGGGELNLLTRYLYQSRGAFVGKFDTLDSGSGLSTHQLDADLTYSLPLTSSLVLGARAYFDLHLLEEGFKIIPAGEQHYSAGSIQLTDGLTETVGYQTITLGAKASAYAELSDANILRGGLVFEHASLSDLAIERDAGSVNCPAEGLQIRGYRLPCARLEGQASGQDRMILALYARDEWTDILANLDLTAGFRLDYFTDAGLVMAPHAGLGYRPFDGLKLGALYAQAFRAPTFKELYQQSAFDPLRELSGNQSLGAVKVHTLELQVEADIITRPVNYRLRGTFFFNWIRDGIALADTQDVEPQYQNIETVDALGSEVEALARFGRRSRIYVNGSWFRARVDGSDQRDQGHLTDVPQMRFNIGLDLTLLDWLDLHLGLQYGSERSNNVRQQWELLRPYKIPPYTLVRVGLTTEPILFEHLVLFAHLTNIFDHDLRDPPPRPDRLPGLLPRAPFSFLVGIGWRP